jgi:uncharacterized membrane protein
MNPTTTLIGRESHVVARLRRLALPSRRNVAAPLAVALALAATAAPAEQAVVRTVYGTDWTPAIASAIGMDEATARGTLLTRSSRVHNAGSYEAALFGVTHRLAWATAVPESRAKTRPNLGPEKGPGGFSWPDLGHLLRTAGRRAQVEPSRGLVQERPPALN